MPLTHKEQGGIGHPPVFPAKIPHSAHFPAGAYLSRTPALGNRRTWTLHFRTKKTQAAVGADVPLFEVYGSPEKALVYYNSIDHALRVYEDTGTGIDRYSVTTDAVNLDITGWTDWVVQFDTTQTAAEDRIKIFRDTVVMSHKSGGVYPSQSFEGLFNSANPHYIALGTWNGSSFFYNDCYLADVQFIEGSIVAPSVFSEQSEIVTGLVIPVGNRSITYGGNGFSLLFDNAADLGKDTSWKDAVGVDYAPDPTFENDRSTTPWTYSGAATATEPSMDGGILDYSGVVSGGSAWITVRNDSTFGVEGKRYLCRMVIDSISIGYMRVGAFKSYTDGTTTENFSPLWNTVGEHFAIIETDADSTHIFCQNYNDTDARISEFNIYELVDQDFVGGNDWTVSDSIAQTLDTLTNNYCTLNPLHQCLDRQTLSNGNLTATENTGTSTQSTVCGTFVVDRGKWYFEGSVTTYGGHYPNIGMIPADAHIEEGDSVASLSGSGNDAWTSCALNQVVGIAADCDAGTCALYKDGAYVATVSMPAGTPLIPAVSSHSGTVWEMAFGATGFTFTPPIGFKPLSSANLPNPQIRKSDSVVDIVVRRGTGGNRSTFGTGTATASSNGYPPDSKAFWEDNTQYIQMYGGVAGQWLEYEFNTPTVIDEFYNQHRNYAAWGDFTYKWQGHDGSDWVDLTEVGYMPDVAGATVTLSSSNTTAYTRYRMLIISGHSYCDIGYVELRRTGLTNIDSLAFQPDFVSIKDRSQSSGWQLFDSVRGAGNAIFPNLDIAQLADANRLSAFIPNGYTLGTQWECNISTDSYVDVCLKAGAKQGFQVSTFTHVVGVDSVVPHGFGKIPTFALLKRIDSSSNWIVYHVALGGDAALVLNSTNGTTGASGIWTPTATEFTIGGSHFASGDYVLYLFTDSDIFKAFSYTGNGVTDGPFVNLGGKPLSILFMKNTAAAESWLNADGIRNPFNTIDKLLQINTSSAEATLDSFDFTSQGFKVVNGATSMNGNGNFIVGLAIIESTTKYTNAF